MRSQGLMLCLLVVILVAVWIVAYVQASYEYSATIGSYWSLSVKASTLNVKSDYLDNFVSAVRAAHLSGNDALFFPTPDNAYEQNLAALLSLQQRMHQWLNQDETTMAYQQAIGQITGQEQEENHVTDVLSGLWWKQRHYFLWNPVYCWLFWLSMIGGGIVGFALAVSD